MDRPIETRTRRRERLSIATRILAAIGVLAAVLLGIRALIAPSIAADELRFATVETGDLVAAIDVTGTVVPRSETVVSAPFGSELRQLHAFPGTAVAAGDPILELERRPLEAEISQLREQLALKQNEREGRRLAIDQSITEADGRRALAGIDLESRTARRDRLEALAEIGAISKGDLLEAQLDVRRSEVELEQLERELRHLRESLDSDLERIDLEASILESQLAEKQRVLALATIRAPHAGVVTWVQEEAGAAVTLGTALARVSDLSSFRLEASASDYYAAELREGQRAQARIGGRDFAATLASVLPAVEAGTVRILLELDDPANAALRANQRADIQLETDRLNEALVVRRGPGLQGRGPAMAFRVEGDRLVRVDARLGLANRDQVQVVDGLAAGDRVVISSTDSIRHLESLTLRQ
ncbi:MAG: HlyD family efflux transporter periplasmic adaptor subunit [Pseudomonadota bacterium]